MRNRKKLMIVMSTILLVAVFSVPALAAETTAPEVLPELKTAINLIKARILEGISGLKLTDIFVAATTSTAVLAMCWFAYRFIRNKVSAAMRKGKL